MYSRQIEDFMKAHIHHITKVKFLVAFKAAYPQSITVQNAQAGFCRAGLIPFDPQVVISKHDIKLWTPIPTGPPSGDADPRVSQTPHNLTDALSQTTLVQNHIACHQGSLPTSLFSTVAMLAKGTEILAYEMTLMSAELE